MQAPSAPQTPERTGKVLLAHPFGNPNSYNAAAALFEASLLSSFCTTLFNPLSCKRRYHPDLLRASVRTFPFREALRLFASATAPKRLYDARSPQAVDYIVRNFDASVARSLTPDLDAVYSYEDGAYWTFLAARERGIQTIYELPIGYYREAQEIFRPEAERDPTLKPFLEALREPEEKLRRKTAELQLADQVIAASSFTKTTILRHISPAPHISVLPYGCEVEQMPRQWPQQDQTGPLRILFAGILGPRKGVHYLFEAMTKLGRSIHLTLAGPWMPGFREWLERRYKVDYEYVGKVEHARLFDLYRLSHLFVFPSLFEGFGLVLLEALASGIPIVATERTGAPDIITDFVHGRLVPAGDAHSLAETLEWFCARRALLPEMGREARLLAERLSFAGYRQAFARLIGSLLRK